MNEESVEDWRKWGMTCRKGPWRKLGIIGDGKMEAVGGYMEQHGM